MKKDQNFETKNRWKFFILPIALFMTVLIIILVMPKSNPAICILSSQRYVIECNISGNLVNNIIATPNNINLAIEKNNCTILGNFREYSIIECNQISEENETIKYKIMTSTYSE